MRTGIIGYGKEVLCIGKKSRFDIRNLDYGKTVLCWERKFIIEERKSRLGEESFKSGKKILGEENNMLREINRGEGEKLFISGKESWGWKFRVMITSLIEKGKRRKGSQGLERKLGVKKIRGP